MSENQVTPAASGLQYSSSQRSLLAVGGVLAVLVLLILVNGVSDLLFGRFYVDLTEDGLYSLSQGTRNIVGGLNEPITIKAYLSKTDGAKYPAIKLYGDRVITLLREYERAGRGKVTVEIFDPRPDTDEESWAQKFGLTPLDMPGGEKLFFGLAAVNSRGEEEVIPVFSLSRQEYLEYDVSRLLYSLSIDKKPVIGVITSLAMKGGPSSAADMMHPQGGGQDPWLLVGQLSNFAEVRFLETTVSTIEPDVKLLMVVHPKNLSEATRYAIDQFVLRGGNLFVAVDPYCNLDRPANPQSPEAMFADKSSDLNNLLSAWGVELVQKKVVGDMNLATKVNAQGGQAVSFPLWLSLRRGTAESKDVINEADLVTGQIDNLLFAWPGALQVKSVEGVTSHTLLQTTPRAMAFDESDYKFGGGSPDAILSKYQPGSTPQIMGVRLSGKLKSNFQQPPSSSGQSSPDVKHLTESTGLSNVIVVSDVDFLGDEVSAVSQNFLGTRMVSLLNHNLVLAGNVAENLLGSSDLISLRSRGQYTRPFSRVQQIEQQAEERFRQERMIFEAEINAANQRLTQLQAGGEKGGADQAFNSVMVDEVRRLREQRAQAQERLREVRRKLRQDKERLGQWLFVLNTFAVPLCLVIGVLAWPSLRAKRSRV